MSESFFSFNFPIGAARTAAPREPCSEKRGTFLCVSKAIDEISQIWGNKTSNEKTSFVTMLQ